MQYEISVAVVTICLIMMTVIAGCCLFTEQEKTKRRKSRKPVKEKGDHGTGKDDAGKSEIDVAAAPAPVVEASTGLEVDRRETGRPELMKKEPAEGKTEVEKVSAQAPGQAKKKKKKAPEYLRLRQAEIAALSQSDEGEQAEALRNKIYEMTVRAEKAERNTAVCSGIMIPLLLLLVCAGSISLLPVWRILVLAAGLAAFLIDLCLMLWNGHVRIRSIKRKYILTEILRDQRKSPH